MPIPQDPRAPHERQRFIELKNVGTDEIPAHAVVEVVDSSRPEQATTETYHGGRTVLHVQKPSGAECACNIAINGPCAIPVNGYGLPGTKDTPVMALVGEAVVSGDMVGPVAGSYYLWKGAIGFQVDGDYDAYYKTARVTRSTGRTLYALTRSAGIPAAYVTGTGNDTKITPGSALCSVFYWDQSNGWWAILKRDGVAVNVRIYNYVDDPVDPDAIIKVSCSDDCKLTVDNSYVHDESSESSESSPSESSPSESSPSESSPSESSPSESSPSESSPSESSPSESSPSESSPSESSPPSESESIPSSEPPPSESESDKSTAIVPAAWSPGGYTALFTLEAPDVRFDDVLTATVTGPDTWLSIDPKFLDVCEPGTVQVCGVVPDVPIAVGAAVVDDRVRVRLPRRKTTSPVQLVIRLTGIRRGFGGHRFPDRTREQFLANERFLQSAYPGAGR
jgi:hypothetical protein